MGDSYALPLILTLGTAWLLFLTVIVKRHAKCLELLIDLRDADERKEGAE